MDMPLMDCDATIPMAVLNEEWAQRNHDQTLEVLARRGGLSPCEAAANIERRPWRHMSDHAALLVIIRAIVAGPRVERDPQSELSMLRSEAQSTDEWANYRCTLNGQHLFSPTLIAGISRCNCGATRKAPLDRLGRTTSGAIGQP